MAKNNETHNNNDEELKDKELQEESTEEVEETEETVDTADNEEKEESSELEDLQAKNEELEDRVLRLQAEIANMQRSSQRERQDAAKYRSQSLAKELLDGMDNLERALDTEITSEDGKALKQGVEMVLKQFQQGFANEQIDIVDPLGEAFDPNFHQAVSIMPGEEGQDSHTIIQVLQKGYILNDRVIRPAMVIVAE